LAHGAADVGEFAIAREVGARRAGIGVEEVPRLRAQRGEEAFGVGVDHEIDVAEVLTEVDRAAVG
jgi:hypothetical protein